MIRSRAALTRQVQDFFHRHLIGVFSWEDIEFEPKQKVELPSNPKERRAIQEQHEGKFHERIEMRFGRYDLLVESTAEHPPLGYARLTLGQSTLDGPLDPATWSQFADFIKAKEPHHGRASRR